jgi:hypothetical protein
VASITGTIEKVIFPNTISSLTVNLGTGDDHFTVGALASAFTATVAINGDGGNDTLVRSSGDANIWSIEGTDSGRLNPIGSPKATFATVENLLGGSGADTFVFAERGIMTGGVDGGTGDDEIGIGGFIRYRGTLVAAVPTLTSVVITNGSSAGDETLTGVRALEFGASSGELFVGVPGALGFTGTMEKLGIVILVAADGRTWHAGRGFLSTASFDVADLLSISGTNLDAAFNGRSTDGKFVDFTRIDDGTADGKLQILTGGATNVDLAFDKPLSQASGRLTVNVADFLYGSADVVFRQEAIDTTDPVLTNATLTTIGVDLGTETTDPGDPRNLTIGADPDNPASIHLVASDGTLGLAVLTPDTTTAPTDTRRWLAVAGTLERIQLFGFEDVVLSADTIVIEINRRAAPRSGQRGSFDWTSLSGGLVIQDQRVEFGDDLSRRNRSDRRSGAGPGPARSRSTGSSI